VFATHPPTVQRGGIAVESVSGGRWGAGDDGATPPRSTYPTNLRQPTQTQTRHPTPTHGLRDGYETTAFRLNVVWVMDAKTTSDTDRARRSVATDWRRFGVRGVSEISWRRMDRICGEDVFDAFLLEFGGGRQARPVCVCVCFVRDSKAVIRHGFFRG